MFFDFVNFILKKISEEPEMNDMQKVVLALKCPGVGCRNHVACHSC